MNAISSFLEGITRRVTNCTKTTHIFLEEHFEMWLETISKEPETIYRHNFLLGFPLPVNRDGLIKQRIALHAKYVDQAKMRVENIDPQNTYIYQEGVTVRFPKVGTKEYNKILGKFIFEMPKLFPYMLVTQVGIPFLQKGAVLLGVEDDNLMDEKVTDGEETELIVSSLSGGETLYPSSVARRDRFVAKHIANTLPSGKTAMLFIGGGHQIEKHLPFGIMVHSHRDIYDQYLKEVRKIL